MRVGAFEQLYGPGRGEFAQKFSKNSNAQAGGMLKLWFDWYIIELEGQWTIKPSEHSEELKIVKLPTSLMT